MTICTATTMRSKELTELTFAVGQSTSFNHLTSSTTSKTMLSQKSIQALADSISDNVCQKVSQSPEFFDFLVDHLQQHVDEVLEEEGVTLDPELGLELSVSIAEKITLRTVY